jgi:DNA mismatch endonuclease (patch repair protein)
LRRQVPHVLAETAADSLSNVAKHGSGGGRPAAASRRRREDTMATSFAVTPGVRSRMQSQRTRDTRPELAVRRLLHAAGMRYRVDAAPLPSLRRRADIVFRPVRVAVFIDGCFWHGCPDHGNPRPVANSWYWPAKIEGNRARDADTDRRLRDAGWAVIRAWEHDDPTVTVGRVIAAVRNRRLPANTPGVAEEPSDSDSLYARERARADRVDGPG